MTKKEFLELVNSTGKNPGEFSDEEIYELGKIHKNELSQSDKNWDGLARLLGSHRNGESLRCWIKYKQRNEGSLPLKCEEPSSNLIDEYDNKLKTLYVERTKNRDVLNAYRRSMRDEARIDLLKDSIKDSIKELKSLPKLSRCLPFDDDELLYKEAVLMLSDLHIGCECDNFYNRYNIEIAAKRLEKLANDTIEYCEMNYVKRLNVCNLGDLIHGLIHISARLEQQCDTVEQVMIAAELVANFLNLLSSGSFELTYRSCLDNHSRIVANKHEHVEKDSFGRLIDWFLQERLKDNDNIEFMSDNLDDGIGKFKVFNKNIIFVHGHEDSIDKMMQNMVGATGEVIDYALMGHYHNEKMKSYQGFKVFVNGSIVGTEQYALSKRLFSKPSQTLLIFSPNDENIMNISIDLNVK